MTKHLLNDICKIHRCTQPARYNVEVIGHPNGDAAASYCSQHASERAGMWDDSPRPYQIVFTGPFPATKDALDFQAALYPRPA